MQKVYIKTFGCQMNEKDSERMLGILGLEKTENPAEADLIIVNTCAVREKPEHKVYSEVGKYIKLRKVTGKDMKIGITGCVAQLYGVKLLEKMNVDFVVGTGALHKLPQIVKEVWEGKKVVDTSLNFNVSDRFLSPLPEPSEFETGSPVKAYVAIQEGCDQFCTFCIVPFTRGREVTRPSSDIIREVVELVSRGVKEVILLGQNVNGYGRNVPDEMTFPELLKALNRIDGLERIRFTTNNPRYGIKELAQVMAECEKVCEHIHLPVQSGSNRILKKMGRRYTREEFLEQVHILREKVPGIAITTDIIVGFPGETDEDFEETLSLLEEVQFDDIYSFKFSPRPGTVAARMPNQIPEKVKAERLKVLQELQDKITLKKMQELVGTVQEVLVEGPAPRNPARDSTGRTRNNKPVNFEGKFAPGKMVKVEITQAFRNSLKGEVVEVVR